MEVVRIRVIHTFHHFCNDDSCESSRNLLYLLDAINLKSDRGQRLCNLFRREVALKIILEPIVRNLHILIYF